MESVLDLLFNPRTNQRPRRTLIYGVEGIGKTTLGAAFPNCVFFPTEDGQRNIECKSFPLQKTLTGSMDLLREIGKLKEIPFKNLVIDSVDNLDAMVQAHVTEVHSEKELSYGKDAELCATEWRKLLDALEWFNTTKQIGIVLIGHSQIERFNDPAGDSYDRYSPRLQKKASALIREWCDECLFATYRTFTKTEELGFNKTRNIAVEGGRVLKTTEKPAHMAKNRLGLPDEIEMSYAALEAAYPKCVTPGNVAGVVIDGTSKKKASE